MVFALVVWSLVFVCLLGRGGLEGGEGEGF